MDTNVTEISVFVKTDISHNANNVRIQAVSYVLYKVGGLQHFKNWYKYKFRPLSM